MDANAISRAVWIVPGVLLVAALGPWPYGYYQLLRLIVTLVALFLIYFEFQRHRKVTAWLVGFVAVAAVFNPIIPLHLNRQTWAGLDVVTAAALIVHMLSVRSLNR